MRPLFLFTALGLLLSTAGCAWHGAGADYLLGPALYRARPGDAESGALTETIHAPILLEGGRQWGMSLGFTRGLTLTPSAMPLAEDPPETARWRCSLLRKRIERAEAPVFFSRRLVGLSALAGREVTSLTAGYSLVTRTRPSDGFTYEIEYFSARPLRSVLRRRAFQPAINHETTTTGEQASACPR